MNKKIAIAGGILLALGVGGYIIYKSKKPKTTPKPKTPSTPNTNTPSSDYGYGEYGDTGGGDSGVFSEYKVTTSGSDLNVRQSPSINSTIVGSLPNGTLIWAMPSQNGWMAYAISPTSCCNQTCPCITGYVSSNYLTAI